MFIKLIGLLLSKDNSVSCPQCLMFLEGKTIETKNSPGTGQRIKKNTATSTSL